MMRQYFIFILIVVFAHILEAGSATKGSLNKKPLNVIVLLVDDMGYGDIAAHGNPIIKTPNFDALYNNSVGFTNFGVSSTCAPTRCALLTGKHEFLSSVTHTIKPMRSMSLESTTVAKLFKAKGYETGLFGKWHLEQAGDYAPWNRGFNETLLVPDDQQKSHYNPKLLKNQIEIETKGYRTDILFDAAMDFIDDNKEQPFFCYLATFTPHSPCVVPEKYSKPYEQYADSMRAIGHYDAKFNGMVANVDENLGKLFAKINALGLDDNTLIVVLNDNGGTFGVDTYNDGRRGVKATSWSGGIRAYSFWKLGDRFSAGERTQMTGHVDVLPTLADFCNLQIPHKVKTELEGNSLKELLDDVTTDLGEDRMQVHHVGRWDNPKAWNAHKYSDCCVRWKNYILTRMEPCSDSSCRNCRLAREHLSGRPTLYSANKENYRLTNPGQWELYDINTDPYQTNDISNQHLEIVKKMNAHYEKWWTKVGKQLNNADDN